MREMESLDGLRGIASLMVVGFHVVVFVAGPVLLDQPGDLSVYGNLATKAWFGWGFLGVDFFFVLSAFLLCQPFLAHGLGGRRELLAYGGKRLLRVVPPYYASLLLAWLLVGRTGHWWYAIDGRQLWTHLTFLHGFWWDTQLNVSAVYWTLAVEVQLYLLLPFLALAFRGRFWWLALLGCLGITVGYRWWVLGEPNWVLLHWKELQLPAYLFHFGLGMSAARFRRQVRDRPLRPWMRDAGILAAALALVVLPSYVLGLGPTAASSASKAFLLLYRPLIALGFGLVVLLACTGEGRIASLLATPPLQALGRWSYSLYLTHYVVGGWLILQAPSLLGLPLGALAFVISVATVLAAAAFYAIVEGPSLRLKRLLLGSHERRGAVESRDAPQP